MNTIKFFIFNILLAIDQLINTLLGGYADETLSSRAHRAYVKGRIFGKIFRPIINTIFFMEPDHCYNAYISEKTKKQQPIDIRYD